MSRWFRHYAGMARDAKLVSAAMRSKQPVERVVWVWAAILESASEINDNGKFALDTSEAAYFLRADQSDLDSIISALEELGRISADSVVHWGERQFTSDRSAERTRNYRDRQKRETVEDNNVTGKSEPVTVTAEKRHSDAPYTETETNTESENNAEPNGSSASAPADPRAELFGRGLKTLARLTGKGPDACRSFVGKCLKAAGDDAVTVLGLIEDADRNRVVDASAWILARLKPAAPPGGRPMTQHQANRQATKEILDELRNFGTGRSAGGQSNLGLLRHDPGAGPDGVRSGIDGDVIDLPSRSRGASG